MLKSIKVTVSKAGRDNGKIFIITEAPVAKQEDFALRVFFAALNAGAEIPEGVAGMGIPGLIEMGYKGLSLIPYEKMKPLLDEMMVCVTYQPDPTKPEMVRGLGYDGDIEEISTMLFLRKEIFNLHTGFFTPAVE